MRLIPLPVSFYIIISFYNNLMLSLVCHGAAIIFLNLGLIAFGLKYFSVEIIFFYLYFSAFGSYEILANIFYISFDHITL